MRPEMGELLWLLALLIFLLNYPNGQFRSFLIRCYIKSFFPSSSPFHPRCRFCSSLKPLIDFSSNPEMGIEDVRLCVLRIVEFSLQISYRFLQNHPYVSTVLLFFFLLYAFFPYIISFLLYFFPFFSCVAILLQIFWTSERFNVRDQKEEHDSKSFIKDVCIDTNLTSRRRSYKVKHEGWEGKDAVSWTAPAGIPVQNASSMEETRKEISADIEKEIRSSAIASAPESFIQVQVNNHPFMRSEPSMSDFLAFGGLNSQTHKSNRDYESVSESSEEVEEEAREDGDKAVKWTEDDQKNLMDLGLSEMERNRRLESLIAKRRGRKLNQGQVEEDATSMNRISSGEIAKVSIAKHRPFDVPSNFKEVEGLPIPGSAPSVLLPIRNPFDLPYDPLEEKPNLMVDNFQQEFAAANQKELSFCRHGSFCFGPSFPQQSHPFFSTEKWDGLGNSRFRRSSPSGRQITNAEIKEKLQGNHVEFHLPDSSRDTTSSSSENLEEMFNGDRAGAPLYGLSDFPSNGDKIDDCFSFALKAAYHTHTYSIASDLQVEVSEISSPPMTLDGTNSPTDGESYTSDGDIEKEITLGGEELWETSSDVYRRIEEEIELRKAHESNEENGTDNVNFWEASKRSEDVTSQWNPFAVISDSMEEDKGSVGGENQSSNSVSEEPCEYQDNAGSDKSAESDKILDLIGEREKPCTYDDDIELPKPGEDEESRVESEDSELHQISGEPIIPGGVIEEVASNSSPPKFKLQEQVSIHPNSPSAFNSPMETEMEYKVQSSSSDEEATPSVPTGNHLVEASATHPTNDETHSSGNSPEEFMDRPSHSSEGVQTVEDVECNGDKNEDVEEIPKLDDGKPTLKSSDEFEFESEKLMGYEADLDPTILTIRLPAETSGEVEHLPERHTPGILSVAEEDTGLNGEEEAIIDSGSSKPKEEENNSNILKHPAEQKNAADLEAPTIVKKHSKFKEDASLELENSIEHGGPKDEPDPDDINDYSSSPFTKPVEQSRHC